VNFGEYKKWYLTLIPDTDSNFTVGTIGPSTWRFSK